MVLGQVGEQGHVVDHTVDAVQGQGVAGDLHDAGVQAALGHHSEEGVQVGGLRGGPHAGDPLRADPGLDGADQAGLLTQRVQGGADQVCHRRLAVGAGHADEHHARVGGAVDAAGQRTEDTAWVVDDDDRHVQAATTHEVQSGWVGEHRDGPGRNG